MSDEIVDVNDNIGNVERVSPKSEASKMSDSDIRWRAKYKGLREEHENFKVNYDKTRKELEDKVQSALTKQSTYEKRLVESELKAHAVAAGIRDIELVKLIDTSSLKIGENGIEGLESAINDFKSRKPDFFGVEKRANSSKNDNFPVESNAKKVHAKDMNKDEYAAQRRQLLSGKRF